MMKKILPLILLLVLLLSLCSQSVSAPEVTIPNQDHFIMDTIYDPESVDPAWAIDTASRALIFNVYDTLVFFDQEKIDFGQYYAVITGEGYTCAYADNDAYDIANVLRNYGNWDTANVRVLVSDAAGTKNDCTRANIQAGISWMASVADDNDICVFFYAGHGGFTVDVPPYDEDDGYDEYICPEGGNILDDELDTWMSAISGYKLVALDSCFSGGFIKADGLVSRSVPDLPRVEITDGFARDIDKSGFNVHTACDENEVAYGSSALENGVFTYYFVEGLEATNADSDADGDVDALEADAYTRPRVQSYTGNAQNPQFFYGTSPNPLTWVCTWAYMCKTWAKVDMFIPHLATEWVINQPPHPAAPPWTNNTWYFKIRTDAPWQDPAYGTVTTEDVEYSFERLMVMDRTGGPAWKIYGPLLGVYHADMEWPENDACPINLAVVVNSTHVWFNLAMPYPPFPFLQILCGSWASIVCKDWCTAHGCWSGYWSDWKTYHDPEISPLDDPDTVMMGTGPYMLDYWTHGVEWSIVRFDDHWQGWPAPNCSRYLDRITNRVVYAWGTRLASFLAGVADEVYAPTVFIPALITNWPTKWMPGMPNNPEIYPAGVHCVPGLPTLTIDAAMFFTFDVNPASAYVGTGSFPNGIPLDFFSDVRIRQAFAYSFDYPTFITSEYYSEASQPTSCVKDGIRYHNPANPQYNFNLTKARTLFMAANADVGSPAFGVWTTGFTMTITYKIGHNPGETAATMLKNSIENLFKFGPDGIPGNGDEAPGTAAITVLGVPGPIFEGELVGYPQFKSLMPLFITDWLNEYTDPHDDVYEFVHTYGHFSGFQGYSNSTVDALIETGIATPDGPAREAIYHTLQLMYFQDGPSVCLAQPLKRHWQRDWVQGWYHNPLYPGQKYFKHLWKGLTGDINGDNMVNILDAGMISAHWYPGPPIGPLGYDKIADIWPKLPDGAVDIFDAATVSAHWLEEVAP